MISFLLVCAVTPGRGSLENLTQPIEDLSFRAQIISGNQHELRKISEDFGKNYSIDYADVSLKEPFKIRVKSSASGQSLLMIGNGSRVFYKIPRVGINSKQNISDSPGRRQTFLDFGLLSESLGKSFFNSKFIRHDRATSDDIYDLTYINSPSSHDTTRFRIWIDPIRHYVTQKVWYGQEGDFRALFLYEDAKEFNGIWVPTKLVVKASDGKVAGEMAYKDIKVNTGLSNELFDIG